MCRVKNAINVFKSSMLILSVVIGAGFASGQEIVASFAQYGFVSLFFLIPLFFLFAYGLILLLNFGKTYTLDFVKKDKFFKTFEGLSLVIFLIIGASMMAAGNEMMSEVIYDFGFPIWSFLTILLSSLILFFGFKTLLNVSAYLIPAIVFGIIYVCIKSSTLSTVSPPTFSSDIPNLFFLMLGSVSYACCNLVLSNKFLFTLGKQRTKKQIRNIAFFVAFILTIIIGIVILSILMNDSLSLYDELPILHMAFMINKIAGYLFFIAIFISILTTLFAAQYSFHELLKTQNKKLLFSLSISIFFTLSLFGFSKIVKYLYPIIGGLGFIMLFYIRKLTFETQFQKTDKKIHGSG